MEREEFIKCLQRATLKLIEQTEPLVKNKISKNIIFQIHDNSRLGMNHMSEIEKRRFRDLSQRKQKLYTYSEISELACNSGQRPSWITLLIEKSTKRKTHIKILFSPRLFHSSTANDMREEFEEFHPIISLPPWYQEGSKFNVNWRRQRLKLKRANNDKYLNDSIKLITTFENSRYDNLKIQTKVAEQLFDLKYELEGKKRTDSEDYLYAGILVSLGQRFEAKRFLKSKMASSYISNPDDYLSLIKTNDDRTSYATEFRDLRESRQKKSIKVIREDDLVFSSSDCHDETAVELKHQNKMVSFNKTIDYSDFSIYVRSKLEKNKLLKLLNEHLFWSNKIPSDLIQYYNDNIESIAEKAGYKALRYGKADQDWYDGLRISGVIISVNQDGHFSCFYTIYDYFNGDYGFRLSTTAESIHHLEYDANL